MYNTVFKTAKFDLNSKKDLEAYDAILNDPTCTITREVREKIQHKDVDSEGTVTGYYEELVAVVTWQKKTFLLE